MSGRTGGALVLAGSVIAAGAGAIGFAGVPVGIGLADIGGWIADASMALVGVGAALLGIAGDEPLDRRATRFGLGTMAVGLLSLTAGSILAISTPYDPLESLPIVLLLLVGLGLTPLGWLITGGSVVRTAGLPRVAGALLLAGIALALLSAVSAGVGVPASVTLIAAAVCVILGCAGVGVIAIRAGTGRPIEAT